MRNTLWLLWCVVRSMRPDLKIHAGRLARSGGSGLKDLIKWLILEKLLAGLYRLGKTYARMSVKLVTGEVRILELPKDEIVARQNLHHVDTDFNKESVLKNFAAPKFGSYAVVSFNNGPGGVPLIELFLIALIRRWKPANAHEVITVARAFDPKALGLGESFVLAATGTIIRKSSTAFSISFPSILFSRSEKDGKVDDKTHVRLHDLPDNYPHGHYLLFRVS